MNRILRFALLPIAAATTAVVLSACGGSSSPGTSSSGMPGMPGMTSSSSSPAAPGTSGAVGPAASGPHNPADVTFAAGMIPHHRQAVVMAQMALAKANNSGVKDLATAIKAAQDPEITTMSGWLVGWGQPVPAASDSSMGSMGSSGSMPSGSSTSMSGMDGMSGTSGTSGMGSMGGMMSDQEMAQLSSASGPAFDKLWLQMMVKHHRGAVMMAQTELTDGANTQAKQLAQSIVDSQSKEITTMTTLLATLGS